MADKLLNAETVRVYMGPNMYLRYLRPVFIPSAGKTVPASLHRQPVY